MFALFILILLSTEAWSFELPEDKQDVFARKACPAFLTFFNVAYMAGATVELPCHCKPQQVQSVVWFFRKHGSSSKETRALTDHHGSKLLDSSRIPHGADLRSRFSIRLFSLLIFRADVDDSGVYICGSALGDYFYAYDLDIQEVQELGLAPESKTMRVTEGRGPRSGQLLYRVFTAFHPWSRCDRCGVPGEQLRVGLCYVDSRFLHVRYRQDNATVASCGSEAVPEAFGRLKRSRPGARLEIRSCHVTCPPKEAPPPSESNKFVVFSGQSTTQTEVQVSYVNHPEDNILTIGCPDAKPDMVVAWDKGSEPIYRLQSSADSRIHVDAGHHLVFTPATHQDSAVYYCWLEGRRVAEIHLLVHATLGKSQSISDFSAAMKLVLTCYGVMTAVFCLLLIIRVGVRLRRDQHMD